MRRSLKFAGRKTAAALAAAAVVTCSGLAAAEPAVAVGPGDWPAFLGGPPHFSASADPAILPANAPVLAQKWHFNIPFVSSPVVADGSVFIGSFAGWLYKINAVTGLLQKKVFLGFQAKAHLRRVRLRIDRDGRTRSDDQARHPVRVGACNKNGIYYALRRSDMAKVWQRRIGVKSSGKVLGQCQAAAAFDGHFLYMGGPGTTIGSETFRGSVLRLNPATGAIGWRTGLPNGVLTSPSVNGSGVIGVGTYDNSTRPNATYLVDATSGAILRTLDPGFDFPQAAFADGWLYIASSTGLYAWGP